MNRVVKYEYKTAIAVIKLEAYIRVGDFLIFSSILIVLYQQSYVPSKCWFFLPVI